jgi:hypothetical protein
MAYNVNTITALLQEFFGEHIVGYELSLLQYPDLTPPDFSKEELIGIAHEDWRI